MKETWRKVPEHDGYEVSSFGRVRSIDRTVQTSTGLRRYSGVLMHPRVNPGGYLCVRLGRGSPTMVHTLVASAFIGPRPEGAQVRHKDGVKTNNTRRNILYGTPKENQFDRRAHGTHRRGSAASNALLKEKEVRLIKRKLRHRESTHVQLAARFKVSKSTIGAIASGRNWPHVKE